MAGCRKLWTAKLAGGSLKSASIQPDQAQFSGVILGIDPSLRGTGFAVIQVTDGRAICLLDSLTLKLSQKKKFVDCLGEIFVTTQRLLEKYAVQAVAVEQTIYVQNHRTVHILGSVRGACLSAVALKQLSVVEFPPLRIKKSIVGIGQATKEQVARMVMELLHIPKILPPDEADAAAAAMCYLFSLKSLRR